MTCCPAPLAGGAPTEKKKIRGRPGVNEAASFPETEAIFSRKRRQTRQAVPHLCKSSDPTAACIVKVCRVGFWARQIGHDKSEFLINNV